VTESGWLDRIRSKQQCGKHTAQLHSTSIETFGRTRQCQLSLVIVNSTIRFPSEWMETNSGYSSTLVVKVPVTGHDDLMNDDIPATLLSSKTFHDREAILSPFKPSPCRAISEALVVRRRTAQFLMSKIIYSQDVVIVLQPIL